MKILRDWGAKIYSLPEKPAQEVRQVL